MEAEAVTPYTESAIIYDHMMKEVDYKSWAKYLLQLMQMAGLDTRRAKLAGTKLCELGTGTGNIAFQLSRHGFNVFGIDSSEKMLEAARSKISARTRQNISFINHNMVTYKSGGEYDIVVCVYDSINYISGPKSLELLFKNVFSNLKRDGIFIFDASLEPNSMNEPKLFCQRGRLNGVHYQRRSSYDPKGKVHITTIRIQKGKRVFEEVHKECVYELKTLRKLANDAGFFERYAAGDFTLLEANENSERVHFILTKQPHD